LVRWTVPTNGWGSSSNTGGKKSLVAGEEENVNARAGGYKRQPMGKRGRKKSGSASPHVEKLRSEGKLILGPSMLTRRRKAM